VPTAFRHPAARFVLLGVLAFGYFVFFPEDLSPLLHPVERALNVSYAVSPWLYAVIGVGILAWTALRIAGRWTAATVSREAPPPP
jgi:hypothetical protein